MQWFPVQSTTAREMDSQRKNSQKEQNDSFPVLVNVILEQEGHLLFTMIQHEALSIDELKHMKVELFASKGNVFTAELEV